ncbi:hypothetical protein [Thermomonospora umbrina]|nr:hypothetical protein [Thermomonospora umbrina]
MCTCAWTTPAGFSIRAPGIRSAFLRDPDGSVFQVYAFEPLVRRAMP